MPEKNKINVMIDGRNFTVVGVDDENYVRNLAYYVDKKIRDLAINNSRLSQTMAATLAALNIADELSKTNTKLKEIQRTISRTWGMQSKGKGNGKAFFRI